MVLMTSKYKDLSNKKKTPANNRLESNGFGPKVTVSQRDKSFYQRKENLRIQLAVQRSLLKSVSVSCKNQGPFIRATLSQAYLQPVYMSYTC